MSPSRERAGADPVAIGVDVGGTTTSLGVVGADGTVRRRYEAATAPTAEAGLKQIADVVEQWCRDEPVRAMGIAVPGLVCDGTIAAAANLPGWVGVPVLDRLTGRLRLPAILTNDGRAAAWGEFVHGRHNGGNLILLALGTGLGGGLVLDGRAFRGAGLAGEVGHLVHVPGGRACPCGARGCWERYVSGSALVQEAAERSVRAAPGDREPLPTGRAVVDAARAGNPVALAALDALAVHLGRGLGLLVTLLDPQSVVVGGGLAAGADLFLPRAQEVLDQAVVGGSWRVVPRVTVATLGPDAGVVGAAALARKASRSAEGVWTW